MSDKPREDIHDAQTHREAWLQIFRAGMDAMAKQANDGDTSSYLAHEEGALIRFLDIFKDDCSMVLQMLTYLRVEYDQDTPPTDYKSITVNVAVPGALEPSVNFNFDPARKFQHLSVYW